MNRSGDVTIPYGISVIDRDASDGKHTDLGSFYENIENNE
jgi:hypothetical protein